MADTGDDDDSNNGDDDSDNGDDSNGDDDAANDSAADNSGSGHPTVAPKAGIADTNSSMITALAAITFLTLAIGGGAVTLRRLAYLRH